MTPPPAARAEFDAYADDYDSALQRGVGLSGEESSFFIEGRVAWVRRRLREMGARPARVLDFGCGTGSSAPHLLGIEGVDHVTGADVSASLLELAKRDHGRAGTSFVSLEEPLPAASFDLAYCNGVFHHIPPPERVAAVDAILGTLRPGGLFALWENNPWNPGTRIVMRRIPFDRDAVTLTAPETRRLLAGRGFEVVHTDFQFVFPRPLGSLRRLEPSLAGLPLGAQYMVLARAPASAG